MSPIILNSLRKCVPGRENLMCKKVMASEGVNPVLQHTLPSKVKDPGNFNVNIILGDGLCVRAMLDLGVSINLMQFSVYE